MSNVNSELHMLQMSQMENEKQQEDIFGVGRSKTLKKTVFTKRWVKCMAVRAVKTVAQTAVATIGTTALITQVDWAVVVSASALAGVLSLLTSLAGLPEVDG